MPRKNISTKDASSPPPGPCAHPGAKGPCVPRVKDGKCIWCEREMLQASLDAKAAADADALRAAIGAAHANMRAVINSARTHWTLQTPLGLGRLTGIISELISEPKTPEDTAAWYLQHAHWRLRSLAQEPNEEHWLGIGLASNELPRDERAALSSGPDRDAIARALEQQARRLYDDTFQPHLDADGNGEISDDDTIRETDGQLWLDAALVDALARLGAKGRTLSAEVADKARARYADYRASGDVTSLWVLWVSPMDDGRFVATKVAALLALALWHDKLRAPWERREKWKAPIITTALSKSIALASKGRDTDEGVIYDGQVIAQLNEHAVMLRRGVPLSRVRARSLASMASALVTAPGQKLWKYLTYKGHQQFVAEERDYRKIVIQGGITGLSKDIGAGGGGGKSRVAEALEAGESVAFHAGGRVYRGLWWVSNYAESGRDMTIMLNDMLLPCATGFNQSLPHNTAQQRDETRLSPIVPASIPLVGNVSKHGLEMLFYQSIMDEFARRADEYAREGMLHLPDSILLALADEIGLPVKGRFTSTIDAILASLKGHKQQSLPECRLLEQKDTEHYDLGLAEPRAFLLDYGKMRLDAKRGIPPPGKRKRRKRRPK